MCFLVMATQDAGCLLANARKRRGVARASITRLCNHLKDLEGKTEQPKTLELARRLSQKLTDLDSEFRTHHHTVIDLTDDEDALAKEQKLLDTHDDLLAGLSVRIKQVIAASSPLLDESSRRIALCKLNHLHNCLSLLSLR